MSLEMHVFIGTVASTRDDDGLGRVSVEIPGLPDRTVLEGVRVLQPSASAGSGVLWLPRPGDEVLVARLPGPLHFVVLGALYNATNTPPPYDQTSTDSQVRVLRSPMGTEVRLDDRQGCEVLTLTGTRDVVIEARGQGTVTVRAAKDVVVEATGNLKLDARGQIEVSAMGRLTLSGQGGVEVKGQAGVTLAGARIEMRRG